MHFAVRKPSRRGLLTRRQLSGPRYRRVFRDVYVPATAALAHELRWECAALILPPDPVITGRSAAALRGARRRTAALVADPRRDPPPRRIRPAAEPCASGCGGRSRRRTQSGFVGRTEMEFYLGDRTTAAVVFITREHLREPHRMVCTVRAALQARAVA
jgi:hypothetical protein